MKHYMHQTVERIPLAQLGLYETCYIHEQTIHTDKSFEEWSRLYDLIVGNNVS